MKKNLEKKEDGKFEILDMKIDNRKTKNLDKNLKTIDNPSDNEKQIKNYSFFKTRTISSSIDLMFLFKNRKFIVFKNK